MRKRRRMPHKEFQRCLKLQKESIYRENSGNKHLRDAVFGWYRYDSRFALPVYDEQGVVERYNVYHVIHVGASCKKWEIIIYMTF